MTVSEVVASLRIRFKAEPFDLGIEIAPPHLLEALRALRDTHGFRFYICATAIDQEGAFEVVHGLRKPDDGDEIWIKTRVPHEEPVLDSAAFLFAGAEWHEREILDLFGMTFRSHPDPRRILMPDDYEGHPLRKDFPMDTPWGYRPPTIVGDA